MKPAQRIFAHLCFAALIMFSGCLEITTTNEVRPDGTIVRTIEFAGDSAAVSGGRLPVELDSSWSRDIKRIDAKKFVLTARRVFADGDEMNRAIGGIFGKTLQYRVRFEKSFDWFFTKYRYEETNLPYRQFNAIPLSQYFSENEIEWVTARVFGGNAKKELHSPEDSLKLKEFESRGEEWEIRNRFEEVFAAFLGGVNTLHDATLPAGNVMALKDTLYSRSKVPLNENNVDTLSTIFASVLKTRAVEKAWKASEADLRRYEEKMEFENSTASNTYITNVVMPGLITSSNASDIEANKATWKDYNDAARFLGYTTWVESRQVNWWAVGGALVVVAALLALLIVSTVRRRSA